ncbi:hypothetical protein H8B06_18675 [Sphingobacterium sp. DN00404]|uniref:Uncharacterized protein n=1 Tax=Sphingobacterium micropteri TaxID=2763501 RepID=A0ABR7YU41_9SPHI|nr:hypothetical protein [Sphingobacterium micropteri]MBD1434855.1 hypothetical protein [Sphingobacterium micropteri]
MTQLNIGIEKSKVIGTLTFHVDRHPFLAKLGFKPKKKKVPITPTKLGVRKKYSDIIVEIEEFWRVKKLSAIKMDRIFSSRNLGMLALALGYLIQNSEKTPPKWMVKSLSKMDQSEFESVAALLDEALDSLSFLQSIISITGIGLQSDETIKGDKDE